MQQAESALHRPGTWVVIVLLALALVGAAAAFKFSRHTYPPQRVPAASTEPVE